MLISALIQEKKTEQKIPEWLDLTREEVAAIRRGVRIGMYADNVYFRQPRRTDRTTPR